MNHEIGSYEAKTKLPELLRGVQAGNRYTITLRGEAIADLIPVESSRGGDAIAAVEQMRKLVLSVQPVKSVNVKALINEGRA